MYEDPLQERLARLKEIKRERKLRLAAFLRWVDASDADLDKQWKKRVSVAREDIEHLEEVIAEIELYLKLVSAKTPDKKFPEPGEKPCHD